LMTPEFAALTVTVADAVTVLPSAAVAVAL